MAAHNLDALVAPVGTVTLFGREQRVLPLDGFSYRLVAQLDDPAATLDPDAPWQIAAHVLPDCSPDEIGRLTAKQVTALIGIAAERVKLVEDLFPNGAGPTTEPTNGSPPA